MTHEEHRELRAKIARMAQECGLTLQEIARLNRVPLWTAKHACLEHGIRSPKMPCVGENCSFRVVAMLQQGMGQSEIAHKIGTTRQYVYGILTRAREAGIAGL